MDALAANVTACVRLKTQATARQLMWSSRKNVLKAPNRRFRVIFKSQRARIIVMLQCPQPTMAFSLQAKQEQDCANVKGAQSAI